jgi:hypothetical protein
VLASSFGGQRKRKEIGERERKKKRRKKDKNFRTICQEFILRASFSFILYGPRAWLKLTDGNRMREDNRNIDKSVPEGVLRESGGPCRANDEDGMLYASAWIGSRKRKQLTRRGKEQADIYGRSEGERLPLPQSPASLSSAAAAYFWRACSQKEVEENARLRIFVGVVIGAAAHPPSNRLFSPGVDVAVTMGLIQLNGKNASLAHGRLPCGKIARAVGIYCK